MPGTRLALSALALTAAALAASPATAAAKTKFEPMVMSWGVQPERCPVTVYFASVAMGVDQATRARIERLLERDPAVVSVRPYLRGREGETLLCIRLARGADIPRLFRRLRAQVRPAPRGFPITIHARGGLRFSRY